MKLSELKEQNNLPKDIYSKVNAAISELGFPLTRKLRDKVIDYCSDSHFAALSDKDLNDLAASDVDAKSAVAVARKVLGI